MVIVHEAPRTSGLRRRAGGDHPGEGDPAPGGADPARHRLRHAVPVHARARVPARRGPRPGRGRACGEVLMLYEFRLPDIGEGVAEGEVVRWLVKEGDVLREDQPMVEIMTDKATVEITSPRAGRVAKRMYAEGQTCPVGKVLIAIELRRRKAARQPAAAAATAAPARAPSRHEHACRTRQRRQRARRGRAGDARHAQARARDRRRHSRRRRLRAGRARDGRTTCARTPRRPPSRTRRRRRSRRSRPTATTCACRSGACARRSPRTWCGRSRPRRTTPTSKRSTARTWWRCASARTSGCRRAACKLSFLPFIVKATTEALAKFPQLNATLDDAASEIVQRRHRHIGLATATDAGLIVPVIRDADRFIGHRAGGRDRTAGGADPRAARRPARICRGRRSPSPAWARWAA